MTAQWEDFISRTGTVTVSRTGEYLDSFDEGWKEEPAFGFGFRTRLTLLDEDSLFLMGATADLPHEELGPQRTGFIGQIDDQSLTWSKQLERDFPVYSGPVHSTSADEVASQPAVGSDGWLYALTRLGVVYAVDLAERELRRLMNFQVEWVFNWYNRPVVGNDGTLYFIQNYRISGSTLWAVDPKVLWDNPLDERDLTDSYEHPGAKWTFSRGPHGGGMGTPVIAADGTVYAPMNGLSALEPETGEEIWRFGSITMGSSPTILSDGTIVVGQSPTGQVFFLRENTDNGGLAKEGWPQAHRDHYHSNNVDHPFVWDRTQPPPYEAVTKENAPSPSACQCALGRPSAPGGVALLIFGGMLVWRRVR